MVKIGIPDPAGQDPQYNLECWPEYANAVTRAGGQAVRLPLTLEGGELDAALRSLDGFVLPGSRADVSPARYGQERQMRTANCDLLREQFDSALLTHASDTGKPVLAICFGMQLLNVWRGGSLLQDLRPLPVNHAAGRQVGVAHSILVDKETLFAGLLTSSEAPSERGEVYRRLGVNSSHHQALDRVGESLAVVAHSAEDGVIEAIEGRVGAAVVLGVQWHPERSIDNSAASRALFTWLVAEADDRRGTKTLEGGDAGS